MLLLLFGYNGGTATTPPLPPLNPAGGGGRGRRPTLVSPPVPRTDDDEDGLFVVRIL